MIERLRGVLVSLLYAGLRSGLRIPRGVSAFVDKLEERIYLRDLLRRLQVDCFIDVGANNGLVSRHVRMLGFRGRILSFEPIREEYEAMLRLASGDAEWRCFNVALAGEAGSRSFNVARDSVFSSFLAPLGEAVDRTESVQMQRLDAVIAEALSDLTDPRIFLKMDTQGFDLEVLAGATGCLDQIVGLQSEISVTPIYEGMPHYLEALGRYESLGFSLMNLFIVNRTPATGGILEYDCLMAREAALDRPGTAP